MDTEWRELVRRDWNEMAKLGFLKKKKKKKKVKSEEEEREDERNNSFVISLQSARRIMRSKITYITIRLISFQPAPTKATVYKLPKLVGSSETEFMK